MMTTIWICVMSFVVRVMSEAVEKWSNSALEKPSTFANSARRRSRAKPAPARAESRPTATAQIAAEQRHDQHQTSDPPDVERLQPRSIHAERAVLRPDHPGCGLRGHARAEDFKLFVNCGSDLAALAGR